MAAARGGQRRGKGGQRRERMEMMVLVVAGARQGWSKERENGCCGDGGSKGVISVLIMFRSVN